jgi:hypothetical protein
LVSEFDDIDKAESLLINYARKDGEKTGYAVSSIIYDIHSVIKELDTLRDRDKLQVLRGLSNFAKESNYVDFDRKVHRELVPKARNSKYKKKAILDSLI